MKKMQSQFFTLFLKLYFLGQIIEPRPYWSFPIQPDIHSSL